MAIFQQFSGSFGRKCGYKWDKLSEIKRLNLIDMENPRNRLKNQFDPTQAYIMPFH